MESKNILYKDLSYRIMEAVFEVHNVLGPGFLEKIYENALAYEFERSNIAFARQKEIQVHYKGDLIGSHILDFVIEDKIILELKAVSSLNDVFKQQTFVPFVHSRNS